jgi:energy-coupling factor transport system permease protein
VRLLEPLGDPASPLGRRNPFAKVLAATVLTFLLLASVDPVTPAVALAIELAVVPLAGMRYSALLRRGAPVLVAAAVTFLFTLVFTTRRDGRLLFELGWLHIHTGTVDSALALSVRILAVAVPGVLVVASTDPTELADSLIQQARVPARFAIGALAAFRLVPLLADEWETLTLARRARGVDAGANPLAGLRLFASTMFGLLVAAIRRGTRLATAMDARGFDSATVRTVARPQHFRIADGLLIGAAAAVAAVSLSISVALGTFRPLL